MKMRDAIGMELERRENVMTFDEWIRQECFKAPPEYAVELAKAAWDYQQARIDELEKALRTIMNMGFESCREEHRVARKALQETTK